MNVLIIHDDKSISTLVQQHLKAHGYTVNRLTSGKKLQAESLQISSDVCILGTKLKDTDCIKVCREMREQQPATFIIGINDRGDWQRKIQLLNSGADDCLNFPFPMQELHARIQALLRRPPLAGGNSLNFGRIRLNPLKMKAFYAEERMDLTKKEYQLLEYFIRNRERTITRAELTDHVWDYKKLQSSNTVDVHIKKLREKLSDHKFGLEVRMQNKKYFDEDNFTDDPNEEIVTVHGVGYRLDKNYANEGDEFLPPPELV